MSRAALSLLLLTAAIATAPAAARPEAPRLLGLQVTNGSTPFLGDNALLTTVSPNGDGFRDAAHVSFRLTAPARVSLAVVQTDTAVSDPEAAAVHVIARLPARAFPKGAGELVWQPAGGTPPRTYVLQLTVRGRGGRRVYGIARPHGPVVRVQGIDAGFPEASYAPGQEAALEVATDARTLTFQVFAYGGGAFPSVRDLRTNGQAMTAAARVDWSAHRDAPAPIRVVRPGDWPSGLYFLRITSDDGRVGYAPFIVRPREQQVLARRHRRPQDEEGRSVVRRGAPRGVARRGALRRLQSRPRPGAVRGHGRRSGAVALRGDRPARRFDVRPLRDRDRRDGPASPPGTIVLARIPDLLGPRKVRRDYYETAEGAKVFDAGAINFAATATEQPVSTMLQNLWARLASP